MAPRSWGISLMAVTAGREAEDRTSVEVALLGHPKETFRSEVSYVAVSSSIFSTRLCGI